MIPTTNTTPAPQLINSTQIAQQQTTSTPKSRLAPLKIVESNWRSQAPMTSPDLQSTPKLQIAQSELPGTSPQAPPTPSIKDTGNGYPNRIICRKGEAANHPKGRTTISKANRWAKIVLGNSGRIATTGISNAGRGGRLRGTTWQF